MRRLLISVAMVLAAAAPANATWGSQVVADRTGSDSALVSNKAGLHAFYCDPDGLDLVYAKLAEPRVTQRLDGHAAWGGRVNADVGCEVAAAVFGGQLHAFYYDATGDDLRWARRTSQGWRFAVLDDGGRAPAVAVYQGRLHVVYLNQGLRMAVFDGVSWSLAAVDAAGGAAQVGVYGGRLHVVYPTSGVCRVRDAGWDGGGWVVREALPWCVTFSLAAAGPSAYLAFYDSATVRYRVWQGYRWVWVPDDVFSVCDGVCAGVMRGAVVGGWPVFVRQGGGVDCDGAPPQLVSSSLTADGWRHADVGVAGVPSPLLVQSGVSLLVAGVPVYGEQDCVVTGEQLLLVTG